MAIPKQQEREYTIEDIYNLPEGERAELIDGRLYLMALPNRIHQKILSFLHLRIGRYIGEKNGSCEVYPAPFAVFLNKDDTKYVEPDISVICDPDKSDDRGCSGAPDWIIEIVSPSNPSHDYINKLVWYKAAGVREYWIVNPNNQTITVYYFESEIYADNYTFKEKIMVNIYDDLTIDFSQLDILTDVTSAPYPIGTIRQMIKETDGDKFEDIRSLNQELTFDAAASEFSKRSIAFGKTQMKNLGIIGSDGLYTNLGLLLSDQCVHSIKVAIFQGTSKSVFRDRREFNGSILKQLNDVYEYIDLNNKTKATFSGLDRMDTRDYPEDAIREILLNSIVHRDYTFSAGILISIFDDRIEFVSLGGLVAGLTINDIMVGASQARNEKLANIFYRLRLIEAYGTGITKILMSYESHSSKPEFITTDGAFCVKLPNINAVISDKTSGTILTNDKDSYINLSKISNFLSHNGSITRKEAEVLLGVKQTMAGNILKKYEKMGIIIAVGIGKNIKYIMKAD